MMAYKHEPHISLKIEQNLVCVLNLLPVKRVGKKKNLGEDRVYHCCIISTSHTCN